MGRGQGDRADILKDIFKVSTHPPPLPWSQQTVGQTTPLPGIWAPARQDPAGQVWELQALDSRTHTSYLSQELAARGAAPSPACGCGCGEMQSGTKSCHGCWLPFMLVLRWAPSHPIPRAAPRQALSPGELAGWVSGISKERVRSSLTEVSADGRSGLWAGL